MLQIQYTKAGLKTLKYVVIKMKLKGDGHDASIRGLFLGYQPLTPAKTEKSGGEPFIWLYDDDCVYLYSLKYYSIQVIEVGLGENGKTTEISAHDDKDQKRAMGKIIGIKEALEDQSRTQDSGLVDISTYKSLPACINYRKTGDTAISTGAASNSTANPGLPSSALHTSTALGSRYTGNGLYSGHKKTETKFIKRTTRYSTEAALIAMSEKIENIKNGTYQPPKLKRIAADMKKEGEVTTKDADTDEWYQGYGGI